MTRFDAVSDALERLVEPFDGEAEEWGDVLARAGAREPARRHARFKVAVVVAVVAAVAGAAATPFGRALVGDTFGRLSAWVNGSPGSPASPSQQQAFE